ncbi:hypothetical protein F4780DRAFT_190330 [Xylariomycetidae sp. FL0641]|nr:hypothetical protein F4780DRAFT_190330 [Xylariomycetidae sp. FL0641]
MPTLFGLGFCNGLLWWHWPEAHSYWTLPMSIFMCGLYFTLDLAYLLVLWLNGEAICRWRIGRGTCADVGHGKDEIAGKGYFVWPGLTDCLLNVQVS